MDTTLPDASASVDPVTVGSIDTSNSASSPAASATFGVDWTLRTVVSDTNMLPETWPKIYKPVAVAATAAAVESRMASAVNYEALSEAPMAETLQIRNLALESAQLSVQNGGLVVKTIEQVKELLQAHDIMQAAAAAAMHGFGVDQPTDAPAAKHAMRLPEGSTT